MRLVHATDKTWYKIVYHHTMYVIMLSNISIKTNFNQIAKVELKWVQYSEGDYILSMTSHYFPVHSPTSCYCVLSHIAMVWRHVKVIRLRTSRATSRHSIYHHTGDERIVRCCTRRCWIVQWHWKWLNCNWHWWKNGNK